MGISFGGLATGMETSTIIEELMNIERAPVDRLQSDKTWLSNKLNAYTTFDEKLTGLYESVGTLVDREQYSNTSITQSSEEYFSTTSSEEALGNTSYQVEVLSLAQRQKSYTDGFESKTESNFGTGDLAITVGDVHHVVEIDQENNSLEGIMKAINDADIGVSASIINDGSDTPFRLTFTGDDVGTDFSIVSSLSDGDDLGSIENSQEAQQAHIRVDDIDITSKSNEIEDAIPGVTIDLLKAEEGKTNTVKIETDNSAITTNINAFVTSYNEIMTFVAEQSTMGDTAAGVLGGDSGVTAIKRHLQNMLTSMVDTGGTFNALSELGLETQKDGQLTLSSLTLKNAIKDDESSVINLLSGREGYEDEGIASQFEEYLQQLTNSTTGLLAGRKQSITDNTKRIDANILKVEARLEKRELTLQNQFNAMEQLVSIMNSQSSYLTTQLESMENLWNYNR